MRMPWDRAPKQESAETLAAKESLSARTMQEAEILIGRVKEEMAKLESSSAPKEGLFDPAPFQDGVVPTSALPAMPGRDAKQSEEKSFNTFMGTLGKRVEALESFRQLEALLRTTGHLDDASSLAADVVITSERRRPPELHVSFSVKEGRRQEAGAKWESMDVNELMGMIRSGDTSFKSIGIELVLDENKPWPILPGRMDIKSGDSISLSGTVYGLTTLNAEAAAQQGATADTEFLTLSSGLGSARNSVPVELIKSAQVVK